MITGVPKEEVTANITLDQQKHFAGIFWMQNFSEGGLPEVSKENFKKLLEMMGGATNQERAKKEAAPAVMSEAKPQQ
jgi:hypothetical protein